MKVELLGRKSSTFGKRKFNRIFIRPFPYVYAKGFIGYLITIVEVGKVLWILPWYPFLHASIQARIRLSKIKNERKSTYLLFIIEIFRIFAQVSTTLHFKACPCAQL